MIDKEYLLRELEMIESLINEKNYNGCIKQHLFNIRKELDRPFEELIDGDYRFCLTLEELSDLAHWLWIKLIKWMLSEEEHFSFSEEKKEHYQELLIPYEDLSEEDKDKDRVLVREFLEELSKRRD